MQISLQVPLLGRDVVEPFLPAKDTHFSYFSLLPVAFLHGDAKCKACLRRRVVGRKDAYINLNSYLI